MESLKNFIEKCSIRKFYNDEYYIKKLANCIYEGFVPGNTFAGHKGSLANKYSDFHVYRQEGHMLYRKTINAPKMLSQYLTRSIYAENPMIEVEKNQALQENIETFLDNIDYWNMLSEETEVMTNLGGMVIKPYISNNEVQLDFVDVLNFFPTRSVNKKPVDCLLISRNKDLKHEYIRLEYHYQPYDDTNKEYIKGKRNIKIEVYKLDNQNNATKINDSEEIYNIFGEFYQEEELEFDLDRPTFVYIKTPTKNHINKLSSEGLGQFASSFDVLKSLDEDYTVMSVEMTNGMMTSYIPESSLNENMVTVKNSSGETSTEFIKEYHPTPYKIVYKSNVNSDDKPTFNNPTLRTTEQVLKFNTDLDLLSVESGFSAGTLRFDGQSITTATQVLVDKSDSAKTVKAYENNLGNGTKELLLLVNQLLSDSNLENFGEFTKKDINIVWKDNVIVDDSQEYEKDLIKLEKGIISKKTFRSRWEPNLNSEEEDKQIMSEQEQELELFTSDSEEDD